MDDSTDVTRSSTIKIVILLSYQTINQEILLYGTNVTNRSRDVRCFSIVVNEQ